MCQRDPTLAAIVIAALVPGTTMSAARQRVDDRLAAMSPVRAARARATRMRHLAGVLASAFTLLWLAAHSASAQRPSPPAPADQLSAQAEQARLANRTREAIELYRRALAGRPQWAEGWAHLGSLLYGRDAYAEAADAFGKSVALDGSIGTTWVMLALCEFQLGRTDDALAHIRRGRELGTTPDPQFRQVMLYHEGLLLLDKSEFERAQETLALLSAEAVESEELLTALGLSVLRIRPSDLPPGESSLRQLVARAGRAEHLAAQKKNDEALRAYERLKTDSPETRNVHYAVGRHYVAVREPAKALTAYHEELQRFPDHVPARLGIAAIKAETDPDAALAYAEEAVRLNPRIPLGHYLLGTLLLHTQDTDRAIGELELGRRAVPDDPRVYYALGRAYARARRPEDAERARATFKRLTDERQRAARREPNEDAGQTGNTPPDP
jgi:tetratricopeptide (TPR) repeat protein